MTVWDSSISRRVGSGRSRTSRSSGIAAPIWSRGPALRRLSHPEDFFGGDKSDKPLQGYTLQGWVAPDITSGQGPLADWSADDLAQYLKTGHNRFAAAAGLMGEVVELSTLKLSDDDAKAMARYLKGQTGPKPPPRAPRTRTSRRREVRSIRISARPVTSRMDQAYPISFRSLPRRRQSTRAIPRRFCA